MVWSFQSLSALLRQSDTQTYPHTPTEFKLAAEIISIVEKKILTPAIKNLDVESSLLKQDPNQKSETKPITHS